jgi:hypothetical protein
MPGLLERKALVFEGYGLQPVRKHFVVKTALAAEGTVFPFEPAFSAACCAPRT